jgi:hypothetical protein
MMLLTIHFVSNPYYYPMLPHRDPMLPRRVVFVIVE